LECFEQERTALYLSDFQVYLQEVSYEDFTKAGQNEILVSTIHKAKGREFDIVYLLLDNQRIKDDAVRRVVYVGMTRAKEQLYICLQHDCLRTAFSQDMKPEYPSGVRSYGDRKEYPEPEELVMQLGHRDVYLGYFETDRVQALMQYLQSGDRLVVQEGQLYDKDTLFLGKEVKGKIQRLVCCSSQFYTELENQKKRGYIPAYARIRFMVKWYDENKDKWVQIILPDVYFRKDEG
jgi:ATP-dependent DNA helicase RecQ